jgi:hypothetical protein
MPRTPEQIKELEMWSSKEIDDEQGVFMYAVREINKIIFAVGTGVLVLSITFIGQLQEVTRPKLLVVSWLLLVGAVAGNGVAHWLTMQIAGKRIELISEWKSEGYPHKPSGINADISDNKGMKRLVRWMFPINIMVPVCLVFGILSLAIFASMNLMSKTEARQQEKTAEKRIEILETKIDFLFKTFEGVKG